MPFPPTGTQDLVSPNIALVGYLVREVAARLPRHLDTDDLHSAGLLGLVQAAAAFDETRGVPFRRFASTRIRGAMLDELRARDWTSRSVRQAGRRREEATSHLAAVLGRMPAQAELADYLGVTVAELDSVDESLHRSVVLSFDAPDDPEAFQGALPHRDPSPEDVVLDEERHHVLHASVDALPERLRTVVTMYFLEGRPMADIAAVLQVSESRVSQMRAEALVLLRDGMNHELEPESVPAVQRPGGCVDRRRTAYYAAVHQASQARALVAAQAGAAAVPDSRRLRLDGIA